MAGGECMSGFRNAVHVGVVLGAILAHPPAAWGLPNPSPLRFIGPTPSDGAVVTSGTVSVAVDASCTFNPNSLTVTLNGTTIPASAFQPFSACTGGRITSQTVPVTVTLPTGTITSAPTSLDAGQAGNFSGSGTGDGLLWNFDGGAAPASGSPVTATFTAAGSFTVRLRATKSEGLAASGLDNSNLVTAQRNFKGGSPTPDSRTLAVAMPPDVDFVNYESSQVHPLALANGRLYAANTADGSVAVFNVAADGSLAFAGDVPVGLDPVSLAVRPGTNEVWVVNHLSDDVSVVDGAARTLLATISACDEPNDVVFASGRAFVSCAGRDDRVKAFDGTTRAEIGAPGIALFGDAPRALATNAGGTQVYATVLESGNKTTALFTALVTSGGGPPPPNPPRNPALGTAPAVGLIVKFNPSNGRWEDEVGGNWSSKVNFTLPDNDVFVINPTGTPSLIRTASGVGTILFDVAVHPTTGELWVANTDARNVVRFEPNLRGHLVQTRITRVNPSTGAVVGVNDLNPNINYSVSPGPAAEIANSLSQPGDGVFKSDGSTFYVTAFGSSKVGVVNASGVVTARIPVGGGPSGVALNEAAGRLYVLNRFDNTISTVDTASQTEIGVTGVAGPAAFDPSPDVIKIGRKFLYEAPITSGHGDIACATCHVFGNFDNIAWDLGDPQGTFLPYSQAPWVHFAPLGPSQSGFDPMKGPMTTQTLRGLKNLEPFHWRGDRQNFNAFNRAFVAFMGMSGHCSLSQGQTCNSTADCPAGELCFGLSDPDMQAYTDFIMTVNFPPNPFRNLDDTLPSSITVPSQSGGGQTATGNPNNGATIFSAANPPLDANVFQCATCHALPIGTTRNLFNGSNEGESQDFKIPQLRNMYEKVGFDVIRPNLQNGTATNIGTSTQKKGFGFIHDGSVSLTEFLAAPVFVSTTQQELDLFAFLLAFDTESAPSVGRQVTFTTANQNNATDVGTINTLIAQANAGRCDVIGKGTMGGVAKGFVYDVPSGKFVPDSLVEQPLAESALRGSIAGADVLTYTAVPPGAGVRMGIDRDRDGWLDRTETKLGFDPANPNSNPWQWTP
jgi:YVTN family beta-propeller protein